MALADYEGRTPASEPHLTVQHATHHRRWSPEQTARDSCETCGASFDLRNRHVLVRVDDDRDDRDVRAADGNADRRYFCGEDCVAAWVGDRDAPGADAESTRP